MTHSAFGPTVSLEEAQRIERETANHLLGSRKLSLIVDLDQTIVHATVDPTVGEWITEGESWEAKQAAKKQAKSSTPTDSDDSSDESSDEEEECNPNWEALKDVRKFRLGPESFGNPSPRSKGKHKMVENDGCMYYIKARYVLILMDLFDLTCTGARPGWKDFLEKAATRYEMHVYTMGTRAYAEQVCAILDPDKKIFGNRLLSRDESGSE
jgi:RNA polymerase II subunit A-like phosphatase